MKRTREPLPLQPTEREQAAVGPRELKDPASVEYAWQTVNYSCYAVEHNLSL